MAEGNSGGYGIKKKLSQFTAKYLRPFNRRRSTSINNSPLLEPLLELELEEPRPELLELPLEELLELEEPPLLPSRQRFLPRRLQRQEEPPLFSDSNSFFLILEPPEPPPRFSRRLPRFSRRRRLEEPRRPRSSRRFSEPIPRPRRRLRRPRFFSRSRSSDLELPRRIKQYAVQLALALKEGSVKLNITKCVFQGPPRVGKTHVKCLLLKKKMEKRSVPTLSTSCAEHPERVIRKVKATAYAGRKGEEEWELMDDKLLAQMISQIASELNLSALQTQPFVTHRETQPTIQGLASKEVFESLGEKMTMPSKKDSTNPYDASHSQNQDLMYFIDSGGQPQFQEVLQAFIPDTDILLLAFNLTQKLSESPLMQYQTDKGTHTHGKYAISNEEIISRFARMVYSSNSKVYVGLIGTHYDQYSPDIHEKLDKKDERLLQIFLFCKDRLLYSNANNKSLLFPINALQAEEGVFDDPVVCQLRKAIEFVLNNVLEVEVPLRWYALELSMQRYAASTGIQVLSMDTCIEMAKDLQFPEEDIPAAALDFLAKYNLILYYPSILPNVVFTSPQVLLDKVTELTECVYSLDASANGPMSIDSTHPPPPSGEYLTMKEEGLVTNQILNGFPKHYKSDLFTFHNLIEIFQHLYIISRLDDSRYFMPALLPHFTPSELSHLYDPSKPPLLFHFTEGCAPTGLFCALLVCLTSPKIGWKFGHQFENSPLNRIRSNAACLTDTQFRILIILVDSFHQFEIHYRCNVEEETRLPHIKSTVISALEEVIDNRKFNISFPQIGFWCEIQHPSEPARHICTVVPKKQLKCSIDPIADCKMTKPMAHWMAALSNDGETTDEAAPTLPKLMGICEEVAPKWMKVGFRLEVPYPRLESIETEKNRDIARLADVFAYWQNNPSSNRPFTWQTMVDVLRNIECNALADKIRDKYLLDQ